MKPRILIDVDGVINALGHVPMADRRLARGYQIQIADGLIDRLRRMIEPFNPIWATAWEHHAAIEISPLIDGVGADWDHIEFPYFGNDPRVRNTWKLEGVLAWAERPENASVPLIWVDDDLDEDAEEWAAERTAAGAYTLLVRTDADQGLTDEDVTRALEVVGSLAT
jgi:hypothetical protein